MLWKTPLRLESVSTSGPARSLLMALPLDLNTEEHEVSYTRARALDHADGMVGL